MPFDSHRICRTYYIRGLVLRKTQIENVHVYTNVGVFGWESNYLFEVTGKHGGRRGLEYLRLQVPRQVITIV